MVVGSAGWWLGWRSGGLEWRVVVLDRRKPGGLDNQRRCIRVSPLHAGTILFTSLTAPLGPLILHYDISARLLLRTLSHLCLHSLRSCNVLCVLYAG
jgi:hypothetical protein